MELDCKNPEVNELDKKTAILSINYESMQRELEFINKQLCDTNLLLNKFCTKLEKEMVIVDTLQEDMRRYQQILIAVVIGLIIFIGENIIKII